MRAWKIIPRASYLSIVLTGGLALQSASQAQELNTRDLTQISLEDLMNVNVVSVSKKEQPLWQAGAAVFVISQEDIRRSGLTNIPDLLRLAPGVNVARISANNWAISIRGFNERYSTKVLVLIDGRSVYTQEFSGVFWDQQSVPLENIERIEVIRGPGGTVWGANAVNGVINIITRNSKDTQGGLFNVRAGDHQNFRELLQHGGRIGSKGTYRAFGTHFNVGRSVYSDRTLAPDTWHGFQAGFRSDWALSPHNQLMVQGDHYRTSQGQNITAILSNDGYRSQTFDARLGVRSTNLQGQWNHRLRNGSETSLNFYYSDSARTDLAEDDQDTADVEFRYHFAGGDRHDFVVGIGYRYSAMDYEGFYNTSYTDSTQQTNLYNSFLQDEIRLTPKVSLTVGSKFEHNSFTGFEFEPSAQLVWRPRRQDTLWASVARAIQQPSWVFSSLVFDAATFPTDGGGFGVAQVRGNPESKAEQLLDFGLGYRMELARRVSLDTTAFRSYYRDLATLETGSPTFVNTPAPPHLVVPSTLDNLGKGRTYGIELSANVQATRDVRLNAGYSFLQMKLFREPGSNDSTIEASPGNSPKHQFQLRSSWNLPRHWEWDTSLFYVSPLRTTVSGVVGAPVPAYTRLDSRLGRRIGEWGEFSIAGQNLLQARHAEFSNEYHLSATQVQRSVTAGLTWRF